VIDKEVVGPGVAVRFPFVPKPDRPFPTERSRRPGNQYTRELQGRESAAADLSGFGPTPRDYDLRIENRKSAAGVHITGDRLSPRCILVHPFRRLPRAIHRLRIAPGKP